MYSLLVKPPEGRWSAALAVRAFNIETAAVREAVRGNSSAGKMRMQWWKDAIAEIYEGRAPPQPIALALAEAVQRHGLTKRWFDRILDARMADLDSPQLQTIKSMETYAENTASSLLYLMLEIAGARGAGVDHAAAHVGKASGICTLLRAVPRQRDQEHSVIPMDVLQRHRLYSSVIRHGPRTPEEAHALAECIYDVSTVGKGHLEAARSSLLKGGRGGAGEGFTTPAFRALLPAVRAGWYLNLLEKCSFDAFDENLRPQSPLSFQLTLAKAVVMRTF
ncbi:unnamed protein product [Discosporangium mesarthrocarpum]